MNGRLLHNRVGYTHRDQIPCFSASGRAMARSHGGRAAQRDSTSGITEAELLKMYPSGKDNQHVQRTVKSALSNPREAVGDREGHEKVPNRKRSIAHHIERVHGELEPMSLRGLHPPVDHEDRPIKPQILRFYVSRPVEELAEALRVLEAGGKIAEGRASPSQNLYGRTCPPVDARGCSPPLMQEDRSMRILSQSDPFCSRFIQEVRLVLRQGWYNPVFKGVDPIGRILMFVVNDYLEIKDVHIPLTYLEEFKESFGSMLENYRDRLVDISVLHAFNGVPVHDRDENIQSVLSELGFSSMGDGERYLRGGVVEPRPRSQAYRALFHHQNLHQKTRWRNETIALSTSTS